VEREAFSSEATLPAVLADVLPIFATAIVFDSGCDWSEGTNEGEIDSKRMAAPFLVENNVLERMVTRHAAKALWIGITVILDEFLKAHSTIAKVSYRNDKELGRVLAIDRVTVLIRLNESASTEAMLKFHHNSGTVASKCQITRPHSENPADGSDDRSDVS
jgi:hypothetical protein